MLNGVLKVVGLAAKFAGQHKVALMLGATMITCAAASVEDDVDIIRELDVAVENVKPGFVESMSMRDRACWLTARITSSSTYKSAKKWLQLGLIWHVIYLWSFCRKWRMSFFEAEKIVWDNHGVLSAMLTHLRFIALWPVYGVAWARDYM